MRARFQAMYGYTSVCRSDFSESYMPTPRFPIEPSASRLVRLVVDRDASISGRAG